MADQSPDVKLSAALTVLGVAGLVLAVALLADGRWALLLASLLLLYGAFVAASHGR